MRPARLHPHAVAITETAGFYFRKPPTTGSGASESVAGRESGGDHLLRDLLGHGHGGSGKRERAVPIMDAPDAGAMSPCHFFEISRARATGGIGENHEREGFWKGGRRLWEGCGGGSGVIPYSRLTARQWRGAARVIGTAGCEACRGLARAAPAKTRGKSESDGQQNKYIESGCLAGGETVTAGVVQ